MSVRCTSVYWEDNCAGKSALENVHNLRRDRKMSSSKPVKVNPLTRLLKPLLKAISKKRREEVVEQDEELQNRQNERLALECSAAAAAAHVDTDADVRADADSLLLLRDVERATKFLVPVHFVRTAAGTFFWTAARDVAASAAADLRAADLELSYYQSPAPQALPRFDRWAQA